MQPAPKMLLLSGPVVLAGLFSLLPANSFFTLLVASFSMRAVVAADIPCNIVLIVHIEYCKHFFSYLTSGQGRLTFSAALSISSSFIFLDDVSEGDTIFVLYFDNHVLTFLTRGEQ